MGHPRRDARLWQPHQSQRIVGGRRRIREGLHVTKLPSWIKKKAFQKEINFAHHIAEFPRCLLSCRGSVSVFGADHFFGFAVRAQFHAREQHASRNTGSGATGPPTDAIHVGSAAKRASAYL